MQGPYCPGRRGEGAGGGAGGWRVGVFAAGGGAERNKPAGQYWAGAADALLRTDAKTGWGPSAGCAAAVSCESAEHDEGIGFSGKLCDGGRGDPVLPEGAANRGGEEERGATGAGGG